jgi:ferredoxin
VVIRPVEPERKPEREPEVKSAQAAPAAEGAIATFRHEDHPVQFPVPAGQTVLDAFLAAGHAQDEPLGYECRKGVCGLCCVRILAGAENFEPFDPAGKELKTMQIAAGVDPDPKQHRLACLARIRGPVELGLPE